MLKISNGKSIRNEVKDFLQNKKLENPGYIVVDLGGSANPWCDELVDYYVDVVRNNERLIKGDLQHEDTWAKIAAVKPDFYICTHTLEDIRDPRFVLTQAKKYFAAGFISMPNKHQELSRGMESWRFPGWCHHRWIFSCTSAGHLKAIAKLPVTVCLSKGGKISSWIFRSDFMAKLARKFMLGPFPKPISWLVPSLATPGFELAILFEGALSFEYVNSDYAGSNIEVLMQLYEDELAAGY